MKLVLRTAQRTKDDINEAIEALNEKFNSYSSVAAIAADPKFVYTAGQLIRQLAVDQFSLIDPTDMLYENRPGVNLGDWVEIEEWVNTAYVVQRSLGGKPKTFTPQKKQYTYAPEDWRVDFAFELEAVATGQLDTSIWVDHMAEALSRFYTKNALDTIDTACATGVQDFYSRDVRTSVATNIDTGAIDAALRRLGDVNSDSVVAGRYYALYPLFSMDNALSEVAAEEFRSRGAIGNFRGATLLVLRDAPNFLLGSSPVPVNRVYLTGADKGGIFAETDLSAFDYSTVDQEELHFRVGTKGRTAFVVFRPWQYHVIEIT